MVITQLAPELSLPTRVPVIWVPPLELEPSAISRRRRSASSSREGRRDGKGKSFEQLALTSALLRLDLNPEAPCPLPIAAEPVPSGQRSGDVHGHPPHRF